MTTPIPSAADDARAGGERRDDAADAARAPAANPAAARRAIDAAWDYGDPAASEARFRAQLPGVADRAAGGDAAWRAVHVQLLTQLARSLGLQGRFDAAHAVLDDAAATVAADDAAGQVRLDLERGRALNSAGRPDAARPHFAQAFERAGAAGLDGLAVDAVHMIAIVEPPEAALDWHARALALAEASPDPDARRWRASLLNNLGWTLHDLGHDDRALTVFEQALALREAAGDPTTIGIARWSVARILRALGRVDEALAIQQALLAAHAAAGRADPHVHDELAACLASLGRDDAAAEHAAVAARLRGGG